MLRCLAVLLTAALTAASIVHTDGISRHLPSALHSAHLGPQFPASSLPVELSVFGPVRLVERDLCGTNADLTGQVAVFRGFQKVPSVSYNSQVASCAEALGAVAVIVLTPAEYPGMTYAVSTLRASNRVTVPFLEASQLRFDEIRDTTAAPVANWTITIGVDRNAWQDCFNSYAFIAICRVVYPLAAAYAACRCAGCLAIHILHPPARRSSDHWVATHWLVKAILAIEVMGSALLFVYCAAGPLFSTSGIPIELHFLFLSSPVAVSSLSSLVGIALFVRWGTMTLSPRRALYEKLLIGGGSLAVLNMVVTTTLLLVGAMTVQAYVVEASIVAGIAAVSAFAIFLRSGLRFLERIQQNRARESTKGQWAVQRRHRTLRKFLVWIALSTVANFLLLLPSLVMGVMNSLVGQRPEVLISGFFLLYSGAILQSLSQSHGLQPREEAGDSPPTARPSQGPGQGVYVVQSVGDSPQPVRRYETQPENHSNPLPRRQASQPLAIYPATSLRREIDVDSEV